MGGNDSVDDIGQFRRLLASIDPQLLTHADRAALIDLIERALAVKSFGGGGGFLYALPA